MKKWNVQSGLASLIVILVGIVAIGAIIAAGYFYAKKYFINVNAPTAFDDIIPVTPKTEPVFAESASSTATTTVATTTATTIATSTAKSNTPTLRGLLANLPTANQNCFITNIVNGQISGGGPGAGSVATGNGTDMTLSYSNHDDTARTVIVRKGDEAYVWTESIKGSDGVHMKVEKLDAYLAGKVDLPGFTNLDATISYECKNEKFTDASFNAYLYAVKEEEFKDLSASTTVQ
jgi:hypothetical protein